MSKTPPKDELKELHAEICRSVLAILQSETASIIGKRIEAASRGVFLPSSGFASLPMLAAMLGISEPRVKARAWEAKLQQYGDGQSILYAVADFAKPRKKRSSRQAKKKSA